MVIVLFSSSVPLKRPEPMWITVERLKNRVTRITVNDWSNVKHSVGHKQLVVGSNKRAPLHTVTPSKQDGKSDLRCSAAHCSATYRSPLFERFHSGRRAA